MKIKTCVRGECVVMILGLYKNENVFVESIYSVKTIGIVILCFAL